MGKKKTIIMPNTEKVLEQLGKQIKFARLRRGISSELLAERAFVSRATIWKIENGSSSISIGSYASVLHALGNLDRDLLLVAKDDDLIKTMQDLNLNIRKRAKKRVDN